MEAWGLKLDVAESTHLAKLRYNEARRRAELADWNAARAAAIVPVRNTARRPIVSSDFLCLGSYLFSLPFLNENAFDDNRRVVNALATKHLPALLDAIREIPDVPHFIGEVFNHYSSQLQQKIAA